MESKYQKELRIILTDIQFHMCLPRKPLSPVRAIEKSLKNNKPGRWYSKNLPMPKKDGTIILPILETDEMYKFIQKKKAEGIRVRVFIPERPVGICRQGYGRIH